MLRHALAIAVLGFWMHAPLAAAQARVQVSPVSVDLTAARPISSLRLRNTAETPAAFDAKAYVWKQANGVDELAPASDLVVSPPAFVIPPGGEQIVRIATLTKGAPAVEQAYRLLFSETPLQNGAAPVGLRLRLQLSLPVFLAPASRGGAPKPQVEFVNVGNQRGVRIDNCRRKRNPTGAGEPGRRAETAGRIRQCWKPARRSDRQHWRGASDPDGWCVRNGKAFLAALSSGGRPRGAARASLRRARAVFPRS